MAELTRGFVHILQQAEAPTQHCRQGLLAEQPMGKPRATKRCSGYDHYLLIEYRKGENKNDIEDNLPSQRCTSSETREPTKSMAVFGDMTVIGDRLHQRAVLLWRGLQAYGPPLCEQPVDTESAGGMGSVEVEGGKAMHPALSPGGTRMLLFSYVPGGSCFSRRLTAHCH